MVRPVTIQQAHPPGAAQRAASYAISQLIAGALSFSFFTISRAKDSHLA